MRNFTKKMTIAAAAMVVAVGVAGAQTINAEVPFGFRAAGTVMPAGSYQVSATHPGGSNPIFKLTNGETNRSVMTLPSANHIQKSSEPRASLTFECSGTDCALVQVAPGSGQTYEISKTKMGKEGIHLAVIRAVFAR